MWVSSIGFAFGGGVFGGTSLEPGARLRQVPHSRGVCPWAMGCHVGSYTIVAGRVGGISLGNHVMIGPHCTITSFNHGYCDMRRPMSEQRLTGSPVIIEDDVWIGANCVVTSGVRLSRGCVIGAGSVVTRDIPAYSIAFGCPARVKGTRGKAKEAG